jgi:hypothetical protein
MTELKPVVSKSEPDEPVAIDDWYYRIRIQSLNQAIFPDYEYIYQPIEPSEAIFHALAIATLPHVSEIVLEQPAYRIATISIPKEYRP